MILMLILLYIFTTFTLFGFLLPHFDVMIPFSGPADGCGAGRFIEQEINCKLKHTELNQIHNSQQQNMIYFDTTEKFGLNDLKTGAERGRS